jgi:hypothetical protein
MHDTTQVFKACQIPNTKINNNTNNYEFTKIYSKIEDNSFFYRKTSICFDKSLHANPLCTTMYIMILVEKCTQ